MARKLLAAAALIGAALSASVSQAAEYTVAIVQSMTGPTGFIGTPLREGALYQADRLNKMGFFGPGNTLKVVWGDDAGARRAPARRFPWGSCTGGGGGKGGRCRAASC